MSPLARYQALFEESPARYQEELAALHRDTHAAEVPLLARPLWLSGRLHDRLAVATETMTRALEAIGARYFSRGDFADYMVWQTGGEALARLDAGQVSPSAFWRFDFLLNPRTGRISFLELNAGDPSGLGWNEDLATAFQTFTPFRRLGENFAVSAPTLMASHQATTRQRWQDFGGQGTPRMAFLAPRESIVWSDHHGMAASYRRAGFSAVVADPQELVEQDGRLWVEGHPIDLVLRDTVDELLLPPYVEAGKRLARVAAAGGVLVLNPFCASFADSKALFALLSAPPEDATWAGTESLVPWTRRPGRSPDADLDHLVANRRRLVLKPIDGYGGWGVTLGLATAPDAWRDAVQEAIRSDRWIAQEYVAPSAEPFPVFEDDHYQGFARRFLTLSAWIHNGHFAGAFGRVGTSRVINVHQGGALLPVFRLD